MGCGGVSTREDATNLMAAGASIIQVGGIAMDDPGVEGNGVDGAPGLRSGVVPAPHSTIYGPY